MLEPEYRRVMQALDDMHHRIVDVKYALQRQVSDDVRPPTTLSRTEADEWWTERARTRGEIAGLESALLVLAQYGRGVSVEYHSGRPMRRGWPK